MISDMVVYHFSAVFSEILTAAHLKSGKCSASLWQIYNQLFPNFDVILSLH